MCTCILYVLGHMCVCVCAWVPRQPQLSTYLSLSVCLSMCPSIHLPTYLPLSLFCLLSIFLHWTSFDSVSVWIWSSPFWLDWLASKPDTLLLLSLTSALASQVCAVTHGFLKCVFLDSNSAPSASSLPAGLSLSHHFPFHPPPPPNWLGSPPIAKQFKTATNVQ